jgi:hypothetical protein
MTQVAGDRASTVILPLPMDMLGRLLDRGRGADRRADDAAK